VERRAGKRLGAARQLKIVCWQKILSGSAQVDDKDGRTAYHEERSVRTPAPGSKQGLVKRLIKPVGLRRQRPSAQSVLELAQ
jgi:hypothetical protein